MKSEKYQPNPTQDFKLSANFAKKLSMQGKTEKAEQARPYMPKPKSAYRYPENYVETLYYLCECLLTDS